MWRKRGETRPKKSWKNKNFISETVIREGTIEKNCFKLCCRSKNAKDNNSPFLDRDDGDGKILTTSWLAMMMIPAIRSDVGEGEEQSRKKGRRKGGRGRGKRKEAPDGKITSKKPRPWKGKRTVKDSPNKYIYGYYVHTIPTFKLFVSYLMYVDCGIFLYCMRYHDRKGILGAFEFVETLQWPSPLSRLMPSTTRRRKGEENERSPAKKRAFISIPSRHDAMMP